MGSQHATVVQALARQRSLARWRSCVAGFVLIALLWPTAGMLPWMLYQLDRAQEISERVAGGHYHAADQPAHHHDASELPGSPTHPDDHNCFECQVLQHLSRCVLPDLGPVIVPPRPQEFTAPDARCDSRIASFIAPRPPIRGPPASIA